MFDVLNSAFDALADLMPTRSAETFCALLSVAVAALLLLVFKYVSWQVPIQQVKDRMTACVLGVWLYRDQPRMIARCQAAGVVHGLHYLGLSLLPLAVLALPMTLLLAQMNAYLACRPAAPGDELVVTVQLATPLEADEAEPTIDLPAGATVAALHVAPGGQEILWRIRCDSGTGGMMTVHAGGESAAKRLAVGTGLARAEPDRFKARLWHRLVYPSEPPLPADGRIEWIHVAYQPRELSLLGWRDHWLWSCFIEMLAAILLLRRPLGVAI